LSSGNFLVFCGGIGKSDILKIFTFFSITHEQLKSLRLLALFTTLFARIYSSRICLQTFLDKPKKVLIEYSFKNLKEEEKQRKVFLKFKKKCPQNLSAKIDIFCKIFADIFCGLFLG